jgi:RNA polymerase sigma-70 factor (ECF subfamily)
LTALRMPSFALESMGLTLRTSDNVDAGVAPLVEAAQSGDVAAFARLYREHVGRVYALCLRLSADKAEAELLTQDVFVRAWERLGSYRGESSFATWLRRVTVNVVLAERRASMRRGRRVVTTDDETLARSPRHRTDDVEIDLDRAIARLPEGARTVFVLHAIEGYRHDEIAELTGIAEGTSRAQYHTARTLLKERLR